MESLLRTSASFRLVGEQVIAMAPFAERLFYLTANSLPVLQFFEGGNLRSSLTEQVSPELRDALDSFLDLLVTERLLEPTDVAKSHGRPFLPEVPRVIQVKSAATGVAYLWGITGPATSDTGT